MESTSSEPLAVLVERGRESPGHERSIVATDHSNAIRLDTLPNEILTTICEMLCFQQFRAWLNSTSKRLHQATLPALYREVHVYKDASVDSLLVRRRSDPSPLISTQTLKFGTHLTRPSAVMQLLPLCGRRLKDLEIGYFDVSPSGLSHAEQMQLGTLLSPEITLHTLRVSKLHDRALHDLLRRQNKVWRLCIHTVYETLEDHDFTGPGAVLQSGDGHFRSLSIIRFESRFEDKCVEHWLRTSSSTLEDLVWYRNCSSSPLGKAFSAPWPLFDRLTRLDISGLPCSKLTALWESCPHLKSLSLSHKHEHPTYSISACEARILLPSIPIFLHRLSLGSLLLRRKTLHALQECLKRMTKLRELPEIWLISDGRSPEEGCELEYERATILDMMQDRGLQWSSEDQYEFMRFIGHRYF